MIIHYAKIITQYYDDPDINIDIIFSQTEDGLKKKIMNHIKDHNEDINIPITFDYSCLKSYKSIVEYYTEDGDRRIEYCSSNLELVF
jgi:hypothetical protein